MDGIFYAEGPGIPAGKLLGDVNATDLAPTVCALLGMAFPAKSEGTALFPPHR
jgi:arylsulfatase A-like enzyme